MALFLLVVSWGRAWSSSQVDSLPSKFWAARKGAHCLHVACLAQAPHGEAGIGLCFHHLADCDPDASQGQA